MKRVLISCEESQEVCKAFRARGFEAYSCDIQECSGGHPEWHIQGDCLPLLNGDCTVHTMDGIAHEIPDKWDMLIAHPPCTYLTVTGNRWFNVDSYGERAKDRQLKRLEAAVFFMQFVNAHCEKIAVENPIGFMSTHYRKADQIIQPYEFGDPVRKATCLWLKGLPALQKTEVVEPEIYFYISSTGKIKSDSRYRSWKTAKDRSKTFPGIAKAMAEQWGALL